MTIKATSILSSGKIAVIGASGFVGRNLYEHFVQLGYDVIGTQCRGKHGNLICCDLTNYEQTKAVLKDVDYVFMCAAKTYGAKACTETPEALVRESVVMNANLFHACYELKVKKLLYISSSVVYQEGFKPFSEEDLDLNQDPFKLYLGVGWVKRYAEKLCEFYAGLGLNVVVVRPTNIYGQYDKYEEDKSHVIPAIIRRVLMRKSPLVIWGSGNNIKDLIYIDDFIRDILLVFENYNSSKPINVCSGNLCSISTIVDTIRIVCGKAPVPIYDKTKPDSVPYKSLAKNKFDSLFGKQEYTSLIDGIKLTVEWIKNALIDDRKLKKG